MKKGKKVEQKNYFLVYEQTNRRQISIDVFLLNRDIYQSWRRQKTLKFKIKDCWLLFIQFDFKFKLRLNYLNMAKYILIQIEEWLK